MKTHRFQILGESAGAVYAARRLRLLLHHETASYLR